MKKISIVIVLIALVGLILAGCADSEPEPKPELQPVSGIVCGIPWPDTEFTGYVIQDSEGSDVGAVLLTIGRVKDIYTLTQRWVFKESLSLLTIANVRADDLKPLAGGVTRYGTLGTSVVTYNYEKEGWLEIDTSTEGECVIDVPEDAFDDNELLFLLRAIPFEVGYTASFTNVIAASAQKHAVTITVVGEEELQIPAGSFDAYNVEFTMAGEKMYLWYGKDTPHYLLKLDNGTNIILLREMREI